MKNHELARTLLVPTKGHTAKLRLAAEKLLAQPEEELSEQYLKSSALEAHILHADDLTDYCAFWRKGLPRPVFDSSVSQTVTPDDDRSTARGYELSCYKAAATGENMQIIYNHVKQGLLNWKLRDDVKAELEKILLTIINEQQLEVLAEKTKSESVLNPMMEVFKSQGLMEIKPTNLEKRIVTGTLRREEGEEVGSFKIRSLNVSKSVLAEFKLASNQTEIKKPEQIANAGLYFVPQNKEIVDPMNGSKTSEIAAYIFYLCLPVQAA